MKDPRLAELEFLLWLDQGLREVRCHHDQSSAETFGLNVPQFRSMVLGLLLDGCLNGPPAIPWGTRYGWQERDNSVIQSFGDITVGQPTRLHLNHSGRLRMARLQDELRANRIRERFNILIDQRHWKRDLAIAMLNTSSQHPLGLLLCDLDKFKQVNDSIGYERGDQCLRRYFAVAAEVLGAEGDVYCRGGDEVLAILPGIDESGVARLAEALREQVETEFKNPEEPGLQPITLSVGAAEFRGRVESDLASKKVFSLLKIAKERGGNSSEIGRL